MTEHPIVAIVGAGPAGLIAAETLARAGAAVTVYERMPSAGRKLLMAGRGGLNLTHSEPIEGLLSRYGQAEPHLRPFVEAFPPAGLRDWAASLGEETFVGSSGRVFPKSMKASPLLRALLRRLGALGVVLRPRMEWRGFDAAGAPLFQDGDETVSVKADATLLALGGASWLRLGSNGAWAPILAAKGVTIAPFRPANVGFHVGWSPPFRERFAGAPLKTITFGFDGVTRRGELIVTERGIEGGVVYAFAAALRDAIERNGEARIAIDLAPQFGESEVASRIARQRDDQSLANRLRRALRLAPVAINLLREAATGPLPRDPAALAARIKSVPLTLSAAEPIARAISSAGGVAWNALDDRLMLTALPGIFVAGEMIDWEAPTGGYLLQACFSTGVAAARGIAERLGLADAPP